MTTAQITLGVRLRWWVKPLLATARVAPWAFAWIGVDRLARAIGRYGVRFTVG